MNEAQQQAIRLAQFYFRLVAERAGVPWDGDDVEVELMVCQMIDAAAAGLRGQLDEALERIDVLDRLRPTCVICLDAAADRQTVNGPACSECVGEPGDQAEDDYWRDYNYTCLTCGAPIGMFIGRQGWHHYRGDGTAASPVEIYDAGHEATPAAGQEHGGCPETSDSAHCGDWHEGGRCGACGQDKPEPEDEPEPDDYDPGPEVDDEGGMSEYRGWLP